MPKLAHRFLRFKIFIAAAAFLLIADAIAAYRFSPAFTRIFEEAVKKRANAEISVKDIRFHPLFLSFSAKELEIFDLEKHSRVLYARRVSGRLGVTSLFMKRVFLSDLVLDKAELEVSKDEHGILNIEKIAQPRQEAVDSGAPAEPEKFYGAKHKGWFFNLYQRIKFAVERRAQAQQARSKSVFKIKKARVKGAQIVLKGPTINLPPFQDVEVVIRNLRWLESNEAYFDSISARGVFKTGRKGRFNIQINWKNKEAEIFAMLINFDMASLRPVYANSLPVYFEKGYLTLRSHSRLSVQKLYSKNRVRMDSCRMIPTLIWSPETQAFIDALNRHPNFDIQFTITGTLEQPSFEGFEESILAVVKGDFNERALSLIRQRAGEELKKIIDSLIP